MDKLEKLALFMKFWFAPWGAAKGECWEGFSGDMPFQDSSAEEVCRDILDGTEDFRWSEIESWR